MQPLDTLTRHFGKVGAVYYDFARGIDLRPVEAEVKYHDFTQITRSITQSEELTTLNTILPLAKQLLKEADYEHRAIRLLGLSVSNPKEEAESHPSSWIQLSFDF